MSQTISRLEESSLDPLGLSTEDGLSVLNWAFEPPAPRIAATPRPNAFGIHDRTTYSAEASLTLELLVRPRSGESLQQNIDRLAAFTRADLRPYWYFKQGTDEERRALLRPEGITTVRDRHARAEVQMQFSIPDGIVESAALKSAVVVPSFASVVEGRSYRDGTTDGGPRYSINTDTDVAMTSASGASGTITSTNINLSIMKDGDVIRVSGFTEAGNNGLFVVNGDGSAGSVAVVRRDSATTVTNETAGDTVTLEQNRAYPYAAVQGNETFLVGGSTVAYPIFVVTGQSVDPIITLVSAGKVITFDSYTVPDGVTLWINTREATVRLEDDAAQNKYAELDLDNTDPLTSMVLYPGQQIVNYTPDGTSDASTRLTVYWRTAWIPV